MNPILFYILSAVLSGLVLFGLSMQSKVKSAVSGNLLCYSSDACQCKRRV